VTHYRLTLTRGRKPVRLLAERHSYSHTPPSGWWRSVMLVGSSIHVRVCWVPDAACEALGEPGGAPVVPALEPPHTPTPAPKGSEAGHTTIADPPARTSGELRAVVPPVVPAVGPVDTKRDGAAPAGAKAVPEYVPPIRRLRRRSSSDS